MISSNVWRTCCEVNRGRRKVVVWSKDRGSIFHKEYSYRGTESGGHRSGLCQLRWRKLDIPVFAGEEAYGWINRLECYFRLKEVSEDEKNASCGWPWGGKH